MGKKKQIAWTLLFAPGMFLLGLVSSFLLPTAPAYTGAVFALLTAGGLFVGPVFAAGGAVGFCGGLAVFTLALGDGLWPIALWLLAPMLVLPPLLLRSLRAKTPLWQAMVNTGIGVFVYGALSYIACNLLLFGFKRQGAVFSIYAIFTVCVYSVAAWLISDVLPIDVSIASPLAGTDLFLCALFGGIISGVGSGLAIRYGGAMDGIEVMAVIFAKRLGVTVGTFVMVYNILLYIVCGIVLQSWILPLYSIVTYAAALKTIDFIVEGIDRAKCAVIITEKPKEICAALGEAFESGTTRLDAKGGFSNRDKAMIYFVVNRYQIIRMRDIVHSIDPAAYITISEIADVFSVNNND